MEEGELLFQSLERLLFNIKSQKRAFINQQNIFHLDEARNKKESKRNYKKCNTLKNR